MKRSHFAAGAAAFSTIGIVKSKARAAQFEYKFGHGTPVDHPQHVRAVEWADAIRRDTNGRLDIKIFPNNTLGSELAALSQLRSGAIQFYSIQGVSLGTFVPAVQMDGVGFAWRNSQQALAAYDGPLGDYLRKEVAAKGLRPFPKVFDYGMRVVTTSTRPIRTAADFQNLKLRTPPAQISIDLFRTLGASPTPIVFPELYTALQTHVVDGQETPYLTISVAKFYEVQKYLSVTNHMPTIFWFLANQEAWNALPPDIRAIVDKHAVTFALQERRDIARESAATADKLRRFGLQFNTNVDTNSMRAALAPFYGRWKNEFGPTAWSLLEATSGKLG
jgi:tripartite ATP-independent transporter DctP family solute receptor